LQETINGDAAGTRSIKGSNMINLAERVTLKTGRLWTDTSEGNRELLATANATFMRNTQGQQLHAGGPGKESA
jgi:hypothetical protein